MAIAARGPIEKWDIGRAVMGEAHPKVEHFINVAGFGANGEVVRRANQMSKSWGGLATFYIATVQTVFSYEAPVVQPAGRPRMGFMSVRRMSCRPSLRMAPSAAAGWTWATTVRPPTDFSM